MRKFSHENTIVVATIVLCFVVTLSLCHVFSGEGFLQVLAKQEQKSVFILALGGYSDMTLARQSAELVKDRGGAGYVKKSEEQIEIIYAVYPDEQSANDVLEKIGEKGVYVTQIEIASSKLSWCASQDKEAVLDALEYFDLCFDTLYETANLLNSASISQNDAKIKIRVLYAQIEEIKSCFYQNIQNSNEEEITQIKLALVTTLALLDNVEFDGGVQSVVSGMRYQLVQMVLCHQSLMSCL